MLRTVPVPQGRHAGPHPDSEAHDRLLTEVLVLRQQVAALYAQLVPSQPVLDSNDHRIARRDATCRPDARLYATYLGTFAVFRDGRPVSLGGSRAVVELCRYLLARAGQPVPREELVELLWPEVDQDRALHRLHVAISTLRQLLDERESRESVLQLDEGCYSLVADRVVTDCDVFEEHYRQGKALVGRDARSAADQFRRALALYAGDYLADAPYAEWSHGPRTHFVERRLSALAFLCDHAATRDDHASVVEYAHQIIEIDNLRERPHRLLMRAHYRMGQRACAVRQYRACVQLLADELGVRPSHETQRLFAAIRDDVELPPEAPLYP